MAELHTVNIPPPKHVKVLGGQGWIGLVDQMGTETSIVNAARVSFGKIRSEMDEKDVKLLKYLVANRHNTPMEHVVFTFLVHCPLFVRSQWHRHRCLSGDTELWFTLPDGRNYKMKLSDAYRKWTTVTKCARKDRQRNPRYKHDRLSAMALKCLDTEKMTFTNTKITDIVCNGVKAVFAVTLSNGFCIKGTADHRVLTERGWVEIQDLGSEDKVAVVYRGSGKCCKQKIKPWFLNYKGDIEDEEWKNYNDKIIVSSYGRVKSLFDTRGHKRREPLLKKISINSQGYPCVSLSSEGKSCITTVHSMVAQAFGIQGKVIRHLDDNKLNCHVTNLAGGTVKDNYEDSRKNGSSMKRAVAFFRVASIEPAGEEPVYDVSVEHSCRNFVANGIVAHNCWSYNEISRRYTEVDLEFYVPPEIHAQASSDRQASTVAPEEMDQDALRKAIDDANQATLRAYEGLLAAGVCREQARGVLSQNLMTTFWATVDLSNLIKFIDLRADAHAQWEIRQYAEAIKTLLKPSLPNVAEIMGW